MPVVPLRRAVPVVPLRRVLIGSKSVSPNLIGDKVYYLADQSQRRTQVLCRCSARNRLKTNFLDCKSFWVGTHPNIIRTSSSSPPSCCVSSSSARFSFVVVIRRMLCVCHHATVCTHDVGKKKHPLGLVERGTGNDSLGLKNKRKPRVSCFWPRKVGFWYASSAQSAHNFLDILLFVQLSLFGALLFPVHFISRHVFEFD